MKKPTSADIIDPYRPPDLALPTLRSPAAPRRAEFALKFVTVVVVILSVFRAVSGFWEFTTAIAPELMRTSAQPSQIPEVDIAMENWQDAILLIHAKYKIVTGVLGLLGMLAGILGCVAGYFVLKKPRQRRNLLLWACAAALVVEGLGLVPFVLKRWEMLDKAENIAQLVTSPMTQTMVRAATTGATIMMIILGMIYILAKCGFFLYALVVVRRPQTINLFSDEKPVETDDPIPAQLA